MDHEQETKQYFQFSNVLGAAVVAEQRGGPGGPVAHWQQAAAQPG